MCLTPEAEICCHGDCMQGRTCPLRASAKVVHLHGRSKPDPFIQTTTRRPVVVTPEQCAAMDDTGKESEAVNTRLHRAYLSSKPFAPGVVMNARDLDRFNEQAQGFDNLQALAFWSFVGICLGLFVVVSKAIGWLSVVL